MTLPQIFCKINLNYKVFVKSIIVADQFLEGRISNDELKRKRVMHRKVFATLGRQRGMSYSVPTPQTSVLFCSVLVIPSFRIRSASYRSNKVPVSGLKEY